MKPLVALLITLSVAFAFAGGPAAAKGKRAALSNIQKTYSDASNGIVQNIRG